MNYQTLQTTLASSLATELKFNLEGGKQIASHFHVTEVGKVIKDFVDCGGVRRKTETCVLQTLVAGDIDHRMSPAKLHDILQKSGELAIDFGTDVDVEVQGETIETYSISQASSHGSVLAFDLERVLKLPE